MNKNSPPIIALLAGCTMLLGACDPEPSPDEFADSEAEPTAGDEEIDDEAATTGEDEDAEVLDDEIDELEVDLDPAEVLADWVGGFGGSQTSGSCPIGFTGMGIAAAPSASGAYVRQIALVCAPEAAIESGTPVLSGGQWIISSGYWYSWPFGSFSVPAVSLSRPLWDLSAGSFGNTRYKAPGSVYGLCDPGYRLNRVAGREGAWVDRIHDYTCWWDGPGTSGPRGIVYTDHINVGGWGGIYDDSSCQTTSENFVDGLVMRHGSLLDGFALDCEE